MLFYPATLALSRQTLDYTAGIIGRHRKHARDRDVRARNFGYAIARAHGGHTDTGSGTGSAATYVRASLAEVAAALAALTGEPHRSPRPRGGDKHGCCYRRPVPRCGPGPAWSGG
jgi:hypothetical protein